MKKPMTQKTTREEAIRKLTGAGESHEIIELEASGAVQRVFANLPETFEEFFRINKSDATQYVYGEERYSYNEIYSRACNLGSALIGRYGIKKGDRVAIGMRNYPEWAISFEAITSIGAVAVALNAMWEGQELKAALDNSGSRLVIADSERIDQLDKVLGHESNIDIVSVRDDKERHIAINELIDSRDSCSMPQVRELGADDLATILYTSGSTGRAKGAVSTTRNVLNAIMSYELESLITLEIKGVVEEPLPFQISMLLGVPLFHVAGLHSVLLASFKQQRKIVAMRKWEPEKAVGLIESEQISMFTGPATLTGDLMDASRRLGKSLSTLRVVGGGGSPRSPQQLNDIKSTFENAGSSQAWGMTETNGLGSIIVGDDYLARATSSGRCAPLLDIKIVDSNDEELPQNEAGELLVRGATVCQQYWNNADANLASFSGGWFRSGDIAYKDEDGYIHVVDRIKDLIIRGGENIGCGEVEAALMKHPLIKEVSVYGLKHDRLGEEVGCTIFGPVDLKKEELTKFLTGSLAKFKIPTYISLSREALPRTASGKIEKGELRLRHQKVLESS